ncbi:uncharacterized protein DSM5745_07481 [Aspergillus mulundensis]|uniref:Uncharacterized protein n=1 Tax=Aspergillus mulundensis TaxID=1810919 RepID=A0A3D8RE49_9EURO|nr:hypothetical protein DSM5745_07481 [Aspergillus mulundensis]RDW72309.1 hypothetical protein DSM5745_07481 [Aspergillus mulundensis]
MDLNTSSQLNAGGKVSARESGANEFSQRPSNNGRSGHSDKTNSSRSNLPKGRQNRIKKRKRLSKNQQRQAISNGNGSLLGKREVILKSSDEYPDIIFEKTEVAANFAKTARSSDEQLVLFVDGSAGVRTPTPSPPSSPDISPSSSPSPPPQPYRMDGGASVVYNEGDIWVTLGFGLPDVEGSRESEVRAIEQGLQLALDMLKSQTTNRRKIIVLSDCQHAARLVAKHITGRAGHPNSTWGSMSRAAAAAARNARTLRQLGVELKILWTPGHLGVEGNKLADCIACHARSSTQALSDTKALELAGRVERMANPYARR